VQYNRMTHAVAMLCALSIASSMLITSSEDSSAYAFRGPIMISGDEGFTAENGVVGGSGTYDDPYLISGWEIEAQTGIAVHVSDTSHHFILRDIHAGAEYNGVAISIRYASGFAVDDCLVDGTGSGLEIRSCHNFTVERSTIDCGTSAYGALATLYATDCRDFTFSSNSISGTGMIGASNSERFVVNDNIVQDGPLKVAWCSEGSILDNSVDRGIELASGSAYGAGTIECEGNTLDGEPIVYIRNEEHAIVDGMAAGQVIVVNSTSVEVNRVETGSVRGIEIMFATNVTVSNCVTEGAHIGINAYCCDDIEVEQCAIRECGVGIRIAPANTARIDHNLIEECERGLVLHSDETSIHHNMMRNLAYGVCFESAYTAVIYSNAFMNVTWPGAYYSPALSYDKIYWNATYPIGGNFWSTYDGTDELGGEAQDQEGADGFGDTPFTNMTVVDNYPLTDPPEFEYGPADDVSGTYAGPIALAALVFLILVGLVVVMLALKRWV
jgi:hypothetical protein